MKNGCLKLDKIKIKCLVISKLNNFCDLFIVNIYS